MFLTRSLLTGWRSGGGGLQCNVSQAVAVGGERIQSKQVTGSPERRRRLLLTSSAYWMSSTAYFSLKCSLDWILKGKNKEHHGQGLAALPSPGYKAQAHPCPTGTWHQMGLPNTDSGTEVLGHQVTDESYLPLLTSAPPSSR